ncbi:MAG: hypothetical protein KGJ62_11860 [Armatimonadetes bacterium]|nr:hypothetical protein [Armatimonadota bacterium]MDE2208013.1 hypothetical protein [Armatimonadota bacterium]
MLTLTPYADRRQFARDVSSFLARTPAENSLIGGMAAGGPENGKLLEEPSGRVMLSVARYGEVEAVAAAASGMPLLVTHARSDVLRMVVAHVCAAAARCPGVIGRPSTVQRLLSEARAIGGPRGRVHRSMRVWSISGPPRPSAVTGYLEQATRRHRDWCMACAGEYLLDTVRSTSRVSSVIDALFRARGLWLWCDPEPRAMAAVVGRSANMTRVGMLYTLPEHRLKGYASSTLSALAANSAAAGLECCTIVERDDPAANGVCHACGFRAVSHLLHVRFPEAVR